MTGQFGITRQASLMILNTRLPSHRILAKSLLPSIEDDEVLRSNFSRVLVEHMSFFAVAYKNTVPSHIH